MQLRFNRKLFEQRGDTVQADPGNLCVSGYQNRKHLLQQYVQRSNFRRITMKQLKDKKYYYPAVIAGGIAALVLVLYLLGVRITYTGTNWKAISTWIAVAAACAAIWFTLQVPQKVAQRQDQIALFEKRLDCYMAVQEILDLSTCIRDSSSAKGIRRAFEVESSLAGTEADGVELLRVSVASYIRQLERPVMSGRFLFENYDDAKILDVLTEMTQLVTAVYSAERESDELTEDEIQQKNRIGSTCQQFRDGSLLSMEEALNLKK